MGHVDDIEFAYREMFNWLRPGGVISHQVDSKTHEMIIEWNGHWLSVMLCGNFYRMVGSIL
jgi:hypothetical protein